MKDMGHMLPLASLSRTGCILSKHMSYGPQRWPTGTLDIVHILYSAKACILMKDIVPQHRWFHLTKLSNSLGKLHRRPRCCLRLAQASLLLYSPFCMRRLQLWSNLMDKEHMTCPAFLTHHLSTMGKLFDCTMYIPHRLPNTRKPVQSLLRLLWSWMFSTWRPCRTLRNTPSKQTTFPRNRHHDRPQARSSIKWVLLDYT